MDSSAMTKLAIAGAMAFAVYNVPSGGSALWTEAHMVTLEDGYFVLQLGEKMPLSAALFEKNPAVFIGVRVESDRENAPRASRTTPPGGSPPCEEV